MACPMCWLQSKSVEICWGTAQPLREADVLLSAAIDEGFGVYGFHRS
jgi:hypothetical protein